MSHLLHIIIQEMEHWLEFAWREIRDKKDNFTVIAAVSGGADSMAMLDALSVVQRAKLPSCRTVRINVVVCHVDHGLRESSARDALFVEQVARNYGFYYRVYKAGKRELGENVEAWARGVRYEFLNRCRAEFSGDVIVTAHHARDQAETVLWRILTGRLLSSGYCINRFEKSSSRRLSSILRPLLGVSKWDVLDYVKMHNVQYVVDETNESLAYTRNRIRAELIPEIIEKYNPNAEMSLAKLAQRFSQDEDALWNAARSMADAIIASNNKNIYWLSETLGAFENAYRWRVIRLIAEAQVGVKVARELSYERLSRVVDVVVNGDSIGGDPIGEDVLGSGVVDRGFDVRQKCIELGRGVRFFYGTRDGFRFDVSRLKVDCGDSGIAADSCADHDCVSLRISEVQQWMFDDGSCCEIEASICDYDSETLAKVEKDPFGESVEYFDFGDVNLEDFEFRVRFRADGDLMRVWKRGSRKVKKLMSEVGLPIFLRHQIPVVIYGESIIWVAGVSRCDGFAVSETSRRIIKLRYLRHCC